MGKKIKNVKDLKKLRDAAREGISLRGEPKSMQIIVHMGTCGIAAGAREILNKLAQELGDRKIETVTLRQSGCIGLCDQEPLCTLQDSDGNEYRYGRLTVQKVQEIVRDHVVEGNPVTGYFITE
ncbi:MAG TPA: (2Fe-2S) ferredoxin domain-containing protein [Spirochaetota bacterium]|nr:(2Fe-2S) ferredoxin domain-containing protein [Spirochaetota bacterium]